MMANLLIIEDHTPLCRLYQSVFGRLGHEVTIANSGEAAVVAAERVQPDLIILDLMLPGMRGAIVAKKLAQSGAIRDVPLIVTTGLPEADARAVAESVGAAAVLAKPFDIKTILDLVKSLLPASDNQQPAP